jgi:hypothetical protein
LDYTFALKIFDYFTTIQNPANDYSPNVTPNYYATTPGTWTNPKVGTPLIPLGIANTTGATANVGESNDGIDGLININTAPWQVLAALPMVPKGQNVDANGVDDNMRLAQAIIYYRDVSDGSGKPHGPFKSIFELNAVKDVQGGSTKTFQNQWGNPAIPTPISSFDSTTLQGDFSPIATATGDGLPGDFEKKFLTLTNISNLITTRSDTFTCYIVVQAWQNVGVIGTSPQLIAQQRVGFIANRVAASTNSANAVQTTNINYTSQ